MYSNRSAWRARGEGLPAGEPLVRQATCRSRVLCCYLYVKMGDDVGGPRLLTLTCERVRQRARGVLRCVLQKRAR